MRSALSQARSMDLSQLTGCQFYQFKTIPFDSSSNLRPQGIITPITANHRTIKRTIKNYADVRLIRR